MTSTIFTTHSGDNGQICTVAMGTSAKGKVMLDQLSSDELQAWHAWMKANPDENGMDWPGWVAVEARKYPAGLLQAAGHARQQALRENHGRWSYFFAWVYWLRCVLIRRGHNYGRWLWPDRAEAHCLCEECADMRTPQNRHSWLHRERTVSEVLRKNN